MIRKFFASALIALSLSISVNAQIGLVSDFNEACDSLAVLLKERTSVKTALKIKAIVQRGKAFDFYFTANLGDLPWHSEDIKWFKETLKTLFPEKYEKNTVGKIFCKKLNLEELVTPELTYSGVPAKSAYKVHDPKNRSIVTKVGGKSYKRGLSGRHIALWQSHGRYYEVKTRRWEWQRAVDFMTVEDMYTQSYVLPFLMPMLENAGAYVLTPRERDTQKNEVVCDNDPAFREDRSSLIRWHGRYNESGAWDDAGEGFADTKAAYAELDNPFRMGTARVTDCVQSDPSAKAVWTPDIPQKGEYAVYVSYKTLPKSTEKAHYTVNHRGGSTSFEVNQTMGGGTWIYLGTFEFDKEGLWSVVLDNRGEKGHVVTADAVRFGGGMGKIARGNDDEPVENWTISGMPAYLEGALYSMQYSGMDTTVTRAYETDYTNDYAGRGAWTSFLSGGSDVNPKQEGLGIPFDLSFAFHTDAGTTPNDSIIGTLAIYTLLCDDSRKLPNGEDRLCAREYTDLVQTQISNDIRATYEPQWSRRQLWDRSYSESRTTSVPGMLLELLSHQNFADMKYGLDPTFRFTVSRAIYKGMLKFLSNHYGCPYAVQPLPVNSFSAVFSADNKVMLSWKPTEDKLEATAAPDGYIVYTRIDDGGWHEAIMLNKPYSIDGKVSADISIEAGHIYSFKVCAFNEGGISFPSEILSAGTPDNYNGQTVLVVNNFTRVSAPAWFDTPTYAGFDTRLDRGVAWGKEINFSGTMYEFNRHLPWLDDDNPGFGASFSDESTTQVAGNSFDYPYIHGKALMALGRRFCSQSSAAFADGDAPAYASTADIICGKQVTVSSGRPGASEDRFNVFPKKLQESIGRFCDRGGNLIISGSHIGTDIWSGIYPVQTDSLLRASTKTFATNVLGFKWITNYASRTATVSPFKNKVIGNLPEDLNLSFINTPNEVIYCAETPDGLLPADNEKSAIILRYSDTNIGAAVAYAPGTYKVITLGFPIELITCDCKRKALIKTALDFFEE